MLRFVAVAGNDPLHYANADQGGERRRQDPLRSLPGQLIQRDRQIRARPGQQRGRGRERSHGPDIMSHTAMVEYGRLVRGEGRRGRGGRAAVTPPVTLRWSRDDTRTGVATCTRGTLVWQNLTPDQCCRPASFSEEKRLCASHGCPRPGWHAFWPERGRLRPCSGTPHSSPLISSTGAFR
jgi:hypothetical protein